jgi:Family of unknown function (DUF6352)
MREFWVSSGHHLSRRTDAGDLAVTDELLTAFLARPELMPPEDACRCERELHASLMAAPHRRVLPQTIDALADPDARENWRIAIAFRDRLLGAGSIEAAYLELVRRGTDGIPPLLIDQLVHLILRNALEGCRDPYVLRAGELFFRPQRAAANGGAILLADAEIVEAQEHGLPASLLVAMLGREPVGELDILSQDNAWTYWSRSDAFTMALAIGSDASAREGLARVIEAWIRHLVRIDVIVAPLAKIEDRNWRWFIGLDAEATRIGNALWHGEPVDEDTLSRVLALFSLTFSDPSMVVAQAAGHPVYLLLAMTRDNIVRIKPQNLIAGLPLKSGARTG